MSIQSEIDRIKENISASYTAVAEKGGTAPELQSSGNLPDAIRSIDTGPGLPSGTEAQVIGFNADGEAVAKTLANNMLPVVDVSHGGTGKTTGPQAMAAMINSCTQQNLTNSSDANLSVPVADATQSAGKVNLKNLRLAFVGTETPIVSAQADYETSRARAISLHTTIPASIPNGCLYGIYA